MPVALVNLMLILGISLPLGLCLLASKRFPLHRTLAGQRSEASRPLIVLVMGAALWSLLYALELRAHDVNTMKHLHQLAFAGVAMVPPALLLVAVALAFGHRASIWTWVGLMVFPFLSASLGLTNSFHGLIWASTDVVVFGPLSALETIAGPWFWLHTYYSYGCIGVSIGLLGLRSKRVWATSPGESAALIGSIGIPWLLNGLFIFFPSSVIDPTPLAALLAAALLFGVALRDRVSSLIPMATSAFFERSGDPLVLIDRNGAVLHANPEVLKLLGGPSDSILGDALCDIWPLFDLQSGLKGNHPDLAIVDPGTRCERGFDVRVYPGGKRADPDSVFIVTLRDITERREAEAGIAYAANHDEATGLASRSFFRERLAVAIEAASDSAQPLALLALDVDGLKTINDLHGQAAGDAVVLEVANALRSSHAVTDLSLEAFPGRLGGDEFVLLLRGRAAVEQAEELAHQLQEAVSKRTNPGPMATLSVGISIFPTHAHDLPSLLLRARLGLEAAKSRGRGECCFFDPEMEQATDRRTKISHDLRMAAWTGEFSLVYQPKVELETGASCGLEALLRWTHPELGPVSPEEFIAIAEKTGSIHEIGRWVLTSICITVAKWRSMGFDPGSVALNVSPEELRDPAFAAGVFEKLQEYEMEPRQLAIEITERSLIDDDITVVTNLRDLRAVGVHISLDDFGAGYSTLACLSRVDIDTIKMDRSLIVDVELHGRAACIVSAIIQLARTLEMNIVAEGVETEDQVETLRGLACPEAQGYFYSRPVTANEIPGLVGGRLPVGKP